MSIQLESNVNNKELRIYLGSSKRNLCWGPISPGRPYEVGCWVTSVQVCV